MLFWFKFEGKMVGRKIWISVQNIKLPMVPGSLKDSGCQSRSSGAVRMGLEEEEEDQDDDMMKSLEDEEEVEEVDDKLKNLCKSTTETLTIWSPVALTAT